MGLQHAMIQWCLSDGHLVYLNGSLFLTFSLCLSPQIVAESTSERM